MRSTIPRTPAPVDAFDKDVVKELLVSIRAHGTLRFVALPFFLASLAVLTRGFYGDGGVPPFWLALAALLLSCIACIVETVLSRNLIVWWLALDALVARQPAWRTLTVHRHAGALWWVRWALFAPYPLSLAFWTMQLLRLLLARYAPWPLPTVSGVAMTLGLAAGMAVAWKARRIWRDARPRE